MFDFHPQALRVLRAYARVKEITLGKVLRNMARDFVRAAQRATPLAMKSTSAYYWWWDKKTGQKRYLHESQALRRVTAGYTKNGVRKTRRLHRHIAKNFALSEKMHKVKIAKGWSKATWIGARIDLGMEYTEQTKIPLNRAQEYAEAVLNLGNDKMPSVMVRARIHFDALPTAEQEILRQGEIGAYRKTMKDVVRQVQRLWNK